MSETIIRSMKELYDYLIDRITTEKIIINDKLEQEVYKLEKKIGRLESIILIASMLSISLYACIWIRFLKGG